MPGCQRPIPPAADHDAIVAVVEGFHAALEQGDSSAALDFLAPDAQVLESGGRETREQYAGNHLGEDIRFARTVPSQRAGLIVRQEGDVAWTTQTSRTAGSYLGRALESEGAELMVLAKTQAGWKIRAIHWSSHSHATQVPAH